MNWRTVVLALPLLGPAGPVCAADIWSSPIATPLAIASCGAGSFLLPGAGCLRIGGSVAAEVGTSLFSNLQGQLGQPRAGLASTTRATDLNQPAVQGRLSADVRLPTELGPVRAYVSIRNLPLKGAAGQ